VLSQRARARLGVLVPSSNVNLEPDVSLLLPPRVTAHFARFGSYDPDAVPDADEMRALGAGEDVEAAAGSLAVADIDVIAFGCTSGTLAHGLAFDRRLAKRLSAACGTPAVTAAGAVLEALEALGAHRVGLACPYVSELTAAAASFLEEGGIEVVATAFPEERLTSKGQRDLLPEDAYALALRSDAPEAEALVVSCTDLRAVEAIDAIEAAARKPVVTSNQALVRASLARVAVDPAEMLAGGRLRTLTRSR
jgi:maleate cis-trans isomerase